MALDGVVSALNSADMQEQLHGLFQVQAAAEDPDEATSLEDFVQQHTQILPAVVNLLHSINTDVQWQAVRTVCMLLGDADAPVNQELIGSTPGALDGLEALLTRNDNSIQAVTSTTLRHLAIRNTANQNRIGSAPGILDSLVSLLDSSCSLQVQCSAAAALMYITAGHQPNQGRVGAMPHAIPYLTSLLDSSDAGLQFVAAYSLSALADVHADNQMRIAQSGGIPVLVGLLSNAEVQEAAASALLNMCSASPQHADWIDNCAGAINGFLSLLQGEVHPAAQAAAALALILLASCRSSIRHTLEQNTSAVWAALPCGLVSKLGLHPPEVRALVQALSSLASASTLLRQSMQDSTQLLLVLEGLQYVCDEATGVELQQLRRMLSTDSSSTPSRPSSTASEEGSPDPWCPCCRDKPKQLAFRCGHAICETCRPQLTPPVCPVCRADISDFQLRLFL